MKKEKKRTITLRGIAPIMFDRYPGDNKTELPVEQKFYFARDGETIVLPSLNIMSMLTAQNTESAPKRFMDSRQYKKVAGAFLSYITITPQEIPFIRNKKEIKFNAFDENGIDKSSKTYIHYAVARLPKGIPNPKTRPVLDMPWELIFDMTIFPNDEFNEELLIEICRKGFIGLGLGTFRGVFGKCVVDKWE